jgi:hypothetical protein
MIIHDPFEIPSERSLNFFTMPNRTVEYLINPKIVQMDDSLKNFKPEEYEPRASTGEILTSKSVAAANVSCHMKNS